MATASELTPEDREEYRTAARSRHRRDMQALAQREKKAWAVARRAASLLRAQYGATRVTVFGSLVHEGCFTPWSDVDVAAWGIQAKDTFRAMSAVVALDPEFQINLVDVNVCAPQLLLSIEREGVDL